MIISAYELIIYACLLVGLSYIFNFISKKTKAPSVLMLIVTGISIKYFVADIYEFISEETFTSVLELLGTVGLITIVLEAAMDLKLKKEKAPLIGKSFIMSLLVLLVTSMGIGLVIMVIDGEAFLNSLIYAIPLSVVSSAVLIPSLSSLSKEKREFLVYESTFSDIVGIMFFNYVVLNEGEIFSVSGGLTILETIIISIVLSYILVWLFSKITTEIKLFLMLAILSALYAMGKMSHLSALLIIFIFGLVLNNNHIFFKWRLKDVLNKDAVKEIKKEFMMITGETAFVLRTFFFIAFGMSIDLSMLLNFQVIAVGTLIVGILYGVRYLNFRSFLKASLFPEVFLAPRGLITILLFYHIPAEYQIHDFSVGILFFVILTTSIVMMVALIKTPAPEGEKVAVSDRRSIVERENENGEDQIEALYSREEE